ncbi:Uncharacterised protein [uncultured archaeon]|nr:Uncharacterised protein [uncultured archaeon]
MNPDSVLNGFRILIGHNEEEYQVFKADSLFSDEGAMMKNNINGFKHVNLLVVIAVIAAAVAVAGCSGTKAPQSQLDFTAKSATGLIITNNGGDPVILKDEKITVKRAVNDKVIDGLWGVPLYGSAPEFQEAPAVDTLKPGQKIRHIWKEPLSLGEVLLISVQDAPTGKTIVDTKVTVT